MGFNINPVAWKGIILSTAGKIYDKTLQDWQRQVADFCAQVQVFLTPAGLASILSGALPVFTVAVDLGTVTSSPQTVACAGSMFIRIRVVSNIATGLQLKLTGLLSGALVVIEYYQLNAVASLLQIVPSGVTTLCTAYSPVLTSVNMSAIGSTFAQNHGAVFVGSANATNLSLNAGQLT